MKCFTFHQNQGSGRIQRWLDYFLISNFLQENVTRADALASFCSDHSPIIFTITSESNNKRGKGLWKFNKSLMSYDEYISKLGNHVSESVSKSVSKPVLPPITDHGWKYSQKKLKKFYSIMSLILMTILMTVGRAMVWQIFDIVLLFGFTMYC